MNKSRLNLYTIGHSNHSLDVFLKHLGDYRIRTVADVRSQPYSKFVPHFHKARLEASLEAAGIHYLYLGRELGGRRIEKELYDPSGNLNHALVMTSPLFQEGLLCLEREAAAHRVVLMCAEEDPTRCHRYYLIAPALLARGITVRHIRADGHILEETEPRREESSPARTHSQLGLFGVNENDELLE